MRKSIIIFFIFIIIIIALIVLLYSFRIIPHKKYSNSNFNIETYISVSSEYFPTRVVFDGVHQTSMIDDKTPTEPIKLNQNDKDKNNEIHWDEITTTGVYKQKLIENINTDDLEKIATLLQNLASEISE